MPPSPSSSNGSGRCNVGASSRRTLVATIETTPPGNEHTNKIKTQSETDSSVLGELVGITFKHARAAGYVRGTEFEDETRPQGSHHD